MLTLGSVYERPQYIRAYQACQPRGAMENAENGKKTHVNMRSNTWKTMCFCLDISVI